MVQQIRVGNALEFLAIGDRYAIINTLIRSQGGKNHKALNYTGTQSFVTPLSY